LLGGWFLRDRGDRHPFGMLAFGTGVAALTMAVPIQMGGPVVPIAWAAEGAALTWASSRLRNPFGAAAAAIIGALAIVHLALFEYPVADLPTVTDSEQAFLNANGLTLAFLVLAIAVAGYFSRLVSIRQLLAAIAIGLVTYAMPFEVSGVSLVIGWSAVAMVAILALDWRALQRGPTLARVPGRDLLALALVVPWVAAAIHLAGFEYSLAEIRTGLDAGTPLLHRETLALLVLVAIAGVLGVFGVRRTDRVVSMLAGSAPIIYAAPFEFSGTALVGVWSLIAVATLAMAMAMTARAVAPVDSRAHEIAHVGWRLPAVMATLLATAHLFAYDYPIRKLFTEMDRRPPFLHSDGLALLFVLAAIAALTAHGRTVERMRVGIVGFGLLIYAMPFELTGVELVGGWAGLAVLAMAAQRWLGNQIDQHERPVGALEWVRSWDLATPAVVAWVLGAAHFLAIELGRSWWTAERPDSPFTDAATLGALFLIAAAIASSMLSRLPELRVGARIGALGIAAALMPFELRWASTVVGWSALAVIALALMEHDRFGRRAYLGAIAALVGMGLVRTLDVVAPLERLMVDDQSQIDHPLLWSGATAALASLAVVFTFARWRFSDYARAHRLAMAAGALMVFLLSIGVVDHFQGQLGEVGLDALQKRAQVGLSILWAVLGGAAFAAGVIRRHREVRLAAIALLGLATCKVFVYDMASLDASYRVLSLIGLGALLLVSSYLYQRLAAPSELDNKPADDLPGPGIDLPAGA
jgi:hypothetical protein